MRLGAVFAGGQARRFGSDKAAALWQGKALLDHVAARLRPQVDALVVVGRAWPGLARIPDRPEGGWGPLAALAGALAHARSRGYAEVLTSGCDLPDLPPDLAGQLTPGPAVAEGQPLLGLWPSLLSEHLDDHLRRTERRAMRAWIDAIGARQVRLLAPVSNVNRPDDLTRLEGG